MLAFLGPGLYLVGTYFYIDFCGKFYGPGSWAKDFTSKIEVKIRAWICGPKTLPHRHGSLPRRHKTLPHRHGFYLTGTDLYLDF